MSDMRPAACPSCGNRLLLATLRFPFVVGHDGSAVPFGTAHVHPGAPIVCNTRNCGWMGDIRDLIATEKA